MALSDFIPEIWSARFTSLLYAARVYGAGTNREYQGEISAAGDTVKIPTATTSVTVADYAKNTDIAAAGNMNGTTEDLDINQQKYFHLYLDDIQRVQQVPDLMDASLRIAAEQVAQVQDSFLQGIYAGAYSSSRRINLASAANATAQTKIEAFLALKRLMTRAFIPLNGRWIVVPPEFIEEMEKHFITQGGSAAGVFAPVTADSVVRNGFSGMLAGFELRVTTKIPTSGSGSNQKWRCIAGQGTEAVTMAEQITSLEAYRPELRFGEAVKALYVYGARAVHSNRVFTLELDDATQS